MIENISFRSIDTSDQDFMWEMMMYASHENTLESVKINPDLARYVINWGREGDEGIIILKANNPVGAVWIRLWTEFNKGYGYINNEVPEIVIAVVPNERGKSLGTLMLTKFLNQLNSTYDTVSMSVRSDNPAVKLYKRNRFIKVEGSEIVNRIGGTSFIMKKLM